ncbi:MAG: hypothetical protein R2838_13250 [Caldilineaceae bacterium]
MLAVVQSAAAAIDAKAGPDEATKAKQWLYSLGEAAANAAKEGDFMGIGGQRVRSPAHSKSFRELMISCCGQPNPLIQREHACRRSALSAGYSRQPRGFGLRGSGAWTMQVREFDGHKRGRR